MLNPLIHNTLLLGAFDDYNDDVICDKDRISIF